MIKRFKQSPILVGAASVAVATMLVKAVSFLKDVIVAGQIGLSPALDVYLFGMALLELVLSLLVGALQYTFIPVIARVDSGEKPGLIQEMYSTIVTLVMGFGSLILLGVFLFDEQLLRIPGASGLVAAERLPYVMQVGVVVVIGYGLSIISQGLLQARGHYFAPAICRMTTPIALSLAILFADPISLRDGTSGALQVLIYGTAVGTVIETILMMLLLRGRTGIRFFPGPVRFSAEMVGMLKQTGLLLLGTACSAGIVFTERAFAALQGEGNVAALAYGYKLTSVGISILALSLSSSMLPHLSKLWARGAYDEAKQLVGRYAIWIFLGMMPISVLASYFSDEIVSLFFERGAFDAADSARVGGIQAVFLLSLPFYLIGVPANRLILAMGKAQVLAVFSVVMLILTYLLNSLFVPRFGLEGIAVTSLILHAAMSFSAIFYCRAVSRLPVPQREMNGNENPSDGGQGVL